MMPPGEWVKVVDRGGVLALSLVVLWHLSTLAATMERVAAGVDVLRDRCQVASR